MVFYWTEIQSLKSLREIIKTVKIKRIRIRTCGVKKPRNRDAIAEIGVLEGIKIHMLSGEGI